MESASPSQPETPPPARTALVRVLQFLRPYRSQVALAFAVLSLRALAQLATRALSSNIFDAVSGPGGIAALVTGGGAETQAASGNAARDLGAVTQATLEVLAAGAVAVLLYAAAIYLWDRMAFKAVRDIRDRMFGHLNRLGIPFFDHSRTGETASRLINDTQFLQQSTQGEMRDLLLTPATVIGGLAWMLDLSWRVTLYGLITTPIVIVLMGALGRAVRRITRNLQHATQRLNGLLSESISGVRVVRLFGLGTHELGRFHEGNQAIYRNAMRATRVTAALVPAQEMVVAVGFAVVVWGGMSEIAHGRLTFGGLVALGLLMQSVGASITRSGRSWAKLQEIGAVCDRVFEFLDTSAEGDEEVDLPAIAVSGGQVVFEDVSFEYVAGVPVLQGVSLEVRPGEVVAVVGESGSGKSTLASILARLYEPTSGRVLVDGQDSTDYTRCSLRDNLGVVLQDSFLFTGSVRENIALGRLGASEEEVHAAARTANAEGFVDQLPDGFETVVGERGATLSGGQRQRIAIARAVLRDPRILILDEATSSLDSEAERVVQEALNHLMQGRTTLAIAHRLSTIQHADRIYVLDHGRVVECGTHAELLSAGGQYARLWTLQSGAAPLGSRMAEVAAS